MSTKIFHSLLLLFWLWILIKPLIFDEISKISGFKAISDLTLLKKYAL